MLLMLEDWVTTWADEVVGAEVAGSFWAGRCRLRRDFGERRHGIRNFDGESGGSDMLQWLEYETVLA